MKSSLPALKTNDSLLKQGIQPDFLTFISSIVLRNRKNAVDFPKGVWVFYKMADHSFPDGKMATRLFQGFFIAKFSIFSTMCGFRKVSNPRGCLAVILQTCEFPHPLIFKRKTMSRFFPTQLGQWFSSISLSSPTYLHGWPGGRSHGEADDMCITIQPFFWGFSL